MTSDVGPVDDGGRQGDGGGGVAAVGSTIIPTFWDLSRTSGRTAGRHAEDVVLADERGDRGHVRWSERLVVDKGAVWLGALRPADGQSRVPAATCQDHNVTLASP